MGAPLNDSFPPNEEFWAVWRETGKSAPTKRHATKLDAINEASRLALTSNERYFVLEAIGIVAVRKSRVDYIEFD